MKLTDAIQILIEESSQNIRGVGQGFRALKNYKEKEKVKRAIARAWLYIYKREMTQQDKFNYFGG